MIYSRIETNIKLSKNAKEVVKETTKTHVTIYVKQKRIKITFDPTLACSMIPIISVFNAFENTPKVAIITFFIE